MVSAARGIIDYGKVTELVITGFAQKVSGYAGRCAEGLWPSGKALFSILGYAQFVGAEPRIHSEPERKRGALPHIRRQSRWHESLFRQSRYYATEEYY